MSNTGDTFASNPPATTDTKSQAINRLPAAPSGVCRYCHCTDFHACEGGCAWLDAAATVCDHPACVNALQSDLHRLDRQSVQNAENEARA